MLCHGLKLRHLLLNRQFFVLGRAHYCVPVSAKNNSETSASTKNVSEDARLDQSDESSKRFNCVGIQMLSSNLHDQIFQDFNPEKHVVDETKKEIFNHLKKHDLLNKKTTILKDVTLELPPLHGKNIDEHFRTLAKQQLNPYVNYAEVLVGSKLPLRPRKWLFREGWTKYDSVIKKCYPVDFPDENALVFDVETQVAEGGFPTIATAVSKNAWYSWCSKRLFDNSLDKTKLTIDDMIPMESSQNHDGKSNVKWQPRLIVGHNVGFDRTYLREQYYIKGTKTRFVDTMSLHIAVSGLTSFQRMLYLAKKAGSNRKEVREHEEEINRRGIFQNFEWTKKSTLNNLNDVYQFYCKGKPLEKHLREVFIEGSLNDVKENFQILMTYCSEDVKATHAVFQHVWREFLERFPHPVTLAGMLEMGTTYLPVNQNWQHYINKAQDKYEELNKETQSLLQKLAEDACKRFKDRSYEDDVWLWDLDWAVKKVKFNNKQNDEKPSVKLETTTKAAKKVLNKKTTTLLYPRWYADLCPRDLDADGLSATEVSMQKRVTPKLLRLVWNGFPLHYDSNHGWGYLIPRLDVSAEELEMVRQESEFEEKTKEKTPEFPLRSLINICKEMRPDWFNQINTELQKDNKLDETLTKIQNSTGREDDVDHLWQDLNMLTARVKSLPKLEQSGVGPYTDVVPGCDFFRLPHKDGSEMKVGNPLAKDFREKIDQGVLRSLVGSHVEKVMKYGNMISYWKNNLDRINSQIVVQLSTEYLPPTITRDPCYSEMSFCGAILPRVITAGTVTRRAVEPTWLTASNAYVDRIGSELKAMVQSPPGYHFVGADVDSQELWIAAILGDAFFAGEHGCTAFGWMTLQGSKAEGTDLHSKTANIVGISREHAKIFNYGRIYGAGQKFAEQMLLKFNHKLTRDEAKSKAKAMFHATKGKKVRTKNWIESEESEEEEDLSQQFKWEGGSESHMFNMLEGIAKSKEPRTPVLGCRISKALEPKYVNSEFMTSRVNWVVQSSAADYLHLMLVCMRWLFEKFDIDGRFCISIHDEVRYLVNSKDRYRAALALQITNLLTRSMFAYKLNFKDLPQSVAFFSSIDVDTCLRKEVTMDCVTPSNPNGLHIEYGIPQGEALSVYEVLKKTNGSLTRSIEMEENPSPGMQHS